MAQKIVVGSTFYNDFANGQANQGFPGGPSSYTLYAVHLDTSLTTLQNTVNVLVDEVNGVQGPNSVLPVDLLAYNAQNRIGGQVSSGLIGIASYAPTIQGSPNENRVDVDTGSVLINGVRGVQATPVTLTATDQGGGETNIRVLAVNTQGVPTLETAFGQREVDLYVFDFATPSQVLSNPRRIADVLNDGDDYERQRKRRGTDPVFDGSVQVSFGASGSTITRLSGSWIADGFLNGMTIQVLDSLLNDGTYTINAAPTATVLTVAESLVDETVSAGCRISGGTILGRDFDQVGERFEAIESLLAGESPPGLSIRFGNGSAADPGIRFASEAMGLYRAAPGQLGLSIGGVLALLLTASQVRPNFAGTGAAPAYAFSTDTTTGLFLQAAGALGFAANGVEALRINAQGQRTSATQGRFIAAATGETHDSGTGTWDVVDIDAAHVQTDVGSFHAGGSPSTPTVPTGFDGSYSFKAFARFVADSAGQRGIRITAGGTIVAEAFVDAAAAGVTTVSCSADEGLAATDTIVVEVYQSSGGNLAYDYRSSFRLED